MERFNEAHKQTVSDFLSCVVVIDDQINFSDDTVSELASPGPFSNRVTDEPTDGAAPGVNVISSQAVVNSFADKGINCVTKKYPWSEGVTTEAPPIVTKSDIVVIDWQLDEGDTDRTAEPIIHDLLIKSKNCFRYVVVYTSESVSTVARTLRDLEIEGLKVFNEQKECIVDLGSNSHIMCRIQVIKKTANDGDLCEKVIEGFSEFSVGFLRNAVLNGITSVRNNTFKLLSLYPKELDKAAISHFTALQSSETIFEQAEITFREYISSLISSDVSDILMYSKGLKSSVEKEVISFSVGENATGSIWTKESKGEVESVKYSELFKADSFNAFMDVWSPGFSTGSATKREKVLKKRPLVRIEGDEKYLKEFSYNDCCKKRALFSEDGSQPPLKFGTIIKSEGENPKYFMCLQPLCDSVRLKGGEDHRFPFVELGVADEGKKFTYIVKPEGSLTCLSPKDKLHRCLESFYFKASDSTWDVRAASGRFECKEGKFYTWVDELKDHYAQGLIQDIANGGTRVGMDQFEWFRSKSG